MKIGITGANSAVGRHLLTEYAGANGSAFVAGVRSQRAAKQLPESQSVTPHIVSYNDPESLATAFQGCTTIIHLAGILFETRDSTYETANVDATRSIVQAAERLGNAHVIFVSALGANSASRNAYLRSKGVCEDLISQAQIPSTIIRTPLLLGRHTAGGQTLLETARRGKAWLLGGGEHRLRPLDVDDLSRAMLGVSERLPNTKAAHDLVGPESRRYRELVQHVARLLNAEVAIHRVPVGLAKGISSVARMILRSGISPDVIDVITSNEEIDRNADRELAVHLTPLDTTIQKLVSSGDLGRNNG
jgi:uncharacterized protein YbjT (DUF2867 family)